MSIVAGVGFSQNKDPKAAVSEAYAMSISPLKGSAPIFHMLFASPTVYNQEELLLALKNASRNAVTIGCSTAGEITSSGGSLDSSVALLSIFSDQMQFVAGIGNNIKENARDAGKELAESIMKASGQKPKAGLMLPDGLAGNGADIVRGVLDVFGQDFMIAGGSAGDDYLFKQTYQYYGDKVLSSSVVGVGLYGNFAFGVGVRHGWIPIGSPRIATKSEGNILYELDNKPAINIYEEMFGKERSLVDKKEPLARLAITYPLGIPAPNKDGYLIRDPITVDNNGAITCAAEVPVGSEVHVMIGSRDEAIDAAEDATRKALSQIEGKQLRMAFLFNCIARKKLFMTKKQEEIDRIQSVLGKDVPLIGFYTYGEQAPLGGEIVTCSFHNETDVIFLLAE